VVVAAQPACALPSHHAPAAVALLAGADPQGLPFMTFGKAMHSKPSRGAERESGVFHALRHSCDPLRCAVNGRLEGP